MLQPIPLPSSDGDGESLDQVAALLLPPPIVLAQLAWPHQDRRWPNRAPCDRIMDQVAESSSAWPDRGPRQPNRIELCRFHHSRDLELQWRWKSTEARSSAVRGEHHLSATLSSNGEGTHGGEAVRRAVRSIRRPSSSPPSSPSLSPPSLSQRPSLSVGPLLLPSRHQLCGEASPPGPRRRPGGGAPPWGRHLR